MNDYNDAMKSLVLVKHVPDANSVFRINSSGTWVDEANLSFAINEYDRYALEELLKLKDQGTVEEVVALTVGPQEASSVLRTCLATGADRAIHIKDDALRGADPLAVAKVIVAAIRDEGFSLILAGLQADDDNHTQTGGLVAGLLDWPSASGVMGLEIAGDVLKVARELEDNELQLVELDLPAVVTVQTGINTPRYASLKGIMAAKKKPVTVQALSDLGIEPQKPRVRSVSLAPPPKGKGAEIVTGSPDEVAAQLVARIKEKAGVI